MSMPFCQQHTMKCDITSPHFNMSRQPKQTWMGPGTGPVEQRFPSQSQQTPCATKHFLYELKRFPYYLESSLPLCVGLVQSRMFLCYFLATAIMFHCKKTMNTAPPAAYK